MRGGLLIIALAGLLSVAAILYLSWGKVENVRTERANAERAAPETHDPERKPERLRKIPPAPEVGLVLTGRVVDAQRQPAGGARVTLWRRDGARFRARADWMGRYALTYAPIPKKEAAELSLVAEHDGGVAARKVVVVAYSPAVLELGTLRLGPRHTATVRVSYRGKPVGNATVLALVKPRGDRVQLDTAQTGAQGLCTFKHLPAGKLQFIAVTDETGRGLTRVEFPREEVAPVEVELTKPRPLRIRVRAGNGGDPVHGATFEPMDLAGFIREPYVPPITVRPTGKDGWTAHDGIGLDKHFLLRAVRDGFPPSRRGGPPSQGDWIIQLPPTCTQTWDVKPGLAPVPRSGVAIRIETSDNMQFHWQPRRGTMEGDVLVVPQCQVGYVAIYGVAPDGSIADLDYDIKAGGGVSTSFRPPRTVRIRVRRDDETPFAHKPIFLDTEGGSLHAGRNYTDTEGVAVWREVYGEQAKIEFEGLVLAQLDLAMQDGDFDVVLPPRRELIFRLKLGGVSGLPEEYSLSIDSETRRRGVIEDPALHALRYPLYTKKSTAVKFYLAAGGYHTHRSEIPLDGEGPIALDIDLVPVSVLSAEIKPRTAIRYNTIYRVQLQRWDKKKQAWDYEGGGQIGDWPVDKAGFIHGEDLEAGKYRFVYTPAGTMSPAVTLGVGERKRTVLDITKVRAVSGRVVAPEGTKWPDVRVDFVGAPVDRSPWEDGKPGWSVDYKKGTFKLEVPGDRDVFLRALHPLLDGLSLVKISSSCDGVVLELVRGPSARFRCEPEINLNAYSVWPLYFISGMPMRQFQSEDHLGVFLLPGRTKPRLKWFDKDMAIEFRVAPNTTQDLLLDLPGLVPRRIDGVTFGPGLTDLGVLRFERGTTLRIDIDALPPGRALIRVSARAAKQGADPYERRGLGYEKHPCLVRGLGRGVFDVDITVTYTDAKGQDYESREFERTVTVSGQDRTDAFRLDLR